MRSAACLSRSSGRGRRSARRSPRRARFSSSARPTGPGGSASGGRRTPGLPRPVEAAQDGPSEREEKASRKFAVRQPFPPVVVAVPEEPVAGKVVVPVAVPERCGVAAAIEAKAEVRVHERLEADTETAGEPGVRVGARAGHLRIEPRDSRSDRDVRNGPPMSEVERAVSQKVVDIEVAQLVLVVAEQVAAVVVRDEGGLRPRPLKLHFEVVRHVVTEARAVSHVVVHVDPDVEEGRGAARELAAEEISGKRRDLDGPLANLRLCDGAGGDREKHQKENPGLHKKTSAASRGKSGASGEISEDVGRLKFRTAERLTCAP